MERARRGLLSWSGVCAMVGAAMWATKSVAILATGDQPEYLFELALAFFGMSILLLVYAVGDQIARFARAATLFAWVGALGAALAGVAYLVGGDSGVFGAASLITVVSIVVVLFLIGGQVARDRLLAKHGFAPRLLAWSFIASIPLGAALSAIDERLLEVALLGVVLGWVTLAVASLRSAPHQA